MTTRCASLSLLTLLSLACSGTGEPDPGATGSAPPESSGEELMSGGIPNGGGTTSTGGEPGTDGSGGLSEAGGGAPLGTGSQPSSGGSPGTGGAMETGGSPGTGGVVDSDYYWEDTFDSDDYQSDYDMNYGQNFKRLTSGGHDDGACVEITVHKGSHYGGSMRFKYKEHWEWEPEAVYAEYYVRYDRSMNTYGGKAPGFSGTYDEAGWGNRPGYGMAGWSSRGTINCDNQDYVKNKFYVYHSYTNYDAPNCPGSTDYRSCNPFPYTGAEAASMTNRSEETWGSGMNWSNGGDMQFDQWYHVKQYIQLNDVGENNGVLRAWVDGEQVLDQGDINFRRTDDLRVYAYWFNYYNGGSDVARETGTVRIDDFKTYVVR